MAILLGLQWFMVKLYSCIVPVDSCQRAEAISLSIKIDACLPAACVLPGIVFLFLAVMRYRAMLCYANINALVPFCAAISCAACKISQTP